MVAAAASSRITLDPAQRRFFADDARVQVVRWHRQKGKDFCAAGKAVLHAMETGQPWFIVSLTQRQADATFDKCKFWAEYYKDRIGEIIVREQEMIGFDELGNAFRYTARSMTLPNGGMVTALPGREPDNLAGLTGNLIITEFALFPYGGRRHWRVIFPLITRGFICVVISTPRDPSTKFDELCNQPDLYSVHICDIYQSVAEGFVLTDEEGKPTTIEKFKELYGDDVGFEREYGLKSTGELDALIPWAYLEAAAARGVGRPFDFLHIKHDAGWAPGFFKALDVVGRAEYGWDVARHGHLSALWCNTGPTGDKHLRALVIMQHTSFALQRQVVCDAMDANPTNVGLGDKTGLGEDSNETLTAKYPGRWDGVNFAGTRKSDIASGLYTAFRDGTQSLPPFKAVGGEPSLHPRNGEDLGDRHKFIATDIYALQRVAGEENEFDEDGKARIKVTETKNALWPDSHCDIAYAGGLALRAGHQATSAIPRVTRL